MENQLAYMLLVVKYGHKKKVSKQLLEFNEIDNVHELFGQYDLILKIRHSSLKEIENFVEQNIRSIPEIERTETLVVSDVAKECCD